MTAAGLDEWYRGYGRCKVSKTPHLDAAIRAACSSSCEYPACTNTNGNCLHRVTDPPKETVRALRAAIPKEPSSKELDAIACATVAMPKPTEDAPQLEKTQYQMWLNEGRLKAPQIYRARPLYRELWDAE